VTCSKPIAIQVMTTTWIRRQRRRQTGVKPRVSTLRSATPLTTIPKRRRFRLGRPAGRPNSFPADHHQFGAGRHSSFEQSPGKRLCDLHAASARREVLSRLRGKFRPNAAPSQASCLADWVRQVRVRCEIAAPKRKSLNRIELRICLSCKETSVSLVSLRCRRFPSICLLESPRPRVGNDANLGDLARQAAHDNSKGTTLRGLCGRLAELGTR
jgi:hypothetical protein